ncbi:MAG: dihydroorotase family protein, partial [Dehalococcoidia bacterium]
MPAQLVVKNARLVIPELGVMEGHLIAEGGQVTALARPGEGVPRARREIDADGRYVLPGAIDPHCHYGLFPPIRVRMPPESAFAVQGGITTLVRYYRRPDSYLKTVPPHIEANQHLHYQDFAIHLTLFTMEQIGELYDYLEVLGINSFKMYMNLKAPLAKGFPIDPQVDDVELQRADLDYDDGLLFAAMEALSLSPGRVRLSVHVEEADILIRQMDRVRALGLGGLAAWHFARPPEAEALGIMKVSYLSRQKGVPVYFPHIGSRLGIQALAKEQMQGTSMVAETCSHYLLHNTESKEAELLKVMPPVRTREDNDATWAALQGGVITTVGSDHIPWTAEEKGTGDIWTIRPAFGSYGLTVPILLSEGFNKERLTIRQVAQVT